ncbi:MAG: hypothetical protein H6R42_122 [Nitrospirae bacterium]|jgi:hypothetical protein|nr:hypothetical protein [Nitrospirota bacterium]
MHALIVNYEMGEFPHGYRRHGAYGEYFAYPVNSPS